jgi:hypothetical protein
MPEDFLKCVREGGRVITIKIGEDKYRHVCYDKNSKPHYGEVKKKKHPKEEEKEKKVKEKHHNSHTKKK